VLRRSDDLLVASLRVVAIRPELWQRLLGQPVSESGT